MNFKVLTALTKARGHRYKARALEKPLCGLQGPSVWGVGWGPDRDFLHTRFQALFSQGGRVLALPVCMEGLWGHPAQQEWQW